MQVLVISIVCYFTVNIRAVTKAFYAGGDSDGLTALFGASSPDLTMASDGSDSLPLPDHDNGEFETTNKKNSKTEFRV